MKHILFPMIFALALVFQATSLSRAAESSEVIVYKSPTCGCCTGWVEHMKANGYSVVSKNTDDMDKIKEILGVPDMFQSCHTATVDGYIIEGHVPADDVTRLLKEKPKAIGLAVPGMPAGSPGMEVGTKDKYDVLLFNADNSADVYATY